MFKHRRNRMSLREKAITASYIATFRSMGYAPDDKTTTSYHVPTDAYGDDGTNYTMASGVMTPPPEPVTEYVAGDWLADT